MAAGLRPDPLGELTALSKPSSWIKGSLLLREGDGKGVEGGEKRGGMERDGWEGEGGRGRGEKLRVEAFLSWILDTPLAAQCQV